MILQELLYEVLFVNIEEEIKKLYPEDECFLSEGKFKELYFLLMQMNPAIVDGEIRIKPVGQVMKTWEIYAVNESEEMSLDVHPWSHWLGMTVDDVIFDYMSKEEFIARCLYTMSFFGFTEEERNLKVKELVDLEMTSQDKVDKFIMEVIMDLIDSGVIYYDENQETDDE